MDWLKLLADRVKDTGSNAAAKELGISNTTVSLVLRGKYGANTGKIEKKVLGAYAENVMVRCLILGEINIVECTKNWKRGKLFGNKATGNPQTFRLYMQCAKCRNEKC